MKLSHEAWRPENRELIKNICPVGNMILHFWCAHQYLYKAGVPEHAGNETMRWSWLRAWYAHMRAMQQLLDQEEIMKCLPRSVFPFTTNSTQELFAWSYASIGNSSKGEEPRLLFNSNTGLIHLPSFVFSGRLEHSRRNVSPKNRVCIPLSDASCWPLRAQYQPDSCSLCCDPNKGPFGDPSCWRNGRTYERCCQQDFKNVKCEEIRKSTPGCIDCAQSLSFFCEEAHRFDAVKAWQHMNETYHEYLAELNITRDLKLEIETNKTQIASLEPLFNKLLKSDVVPQQTAYYMHVSNNQFRKHISKVRAENRTLEWLKSEVRPPVAGNHSIVAKELRKLTDIRKSANSTLHDNRKKEQSEIARKAWLIERLANNSIEIVEVKRAIAAIDFLPIYMSGNETFNTLVEINATIKSLESERERIKRRLGELDEATRARELETGIPQKIIEAGETIKRLHSELTSFEPSIKKTKDAVENMKKRHEDCVSVEKAPETIQQLEIELKDCVSKISEKESELVRFESILNESRLVSDDDTNPQSVVYPIEILRQHAECLNLRLEDLKSELLDAIRAHNVKSWDIFTVESEIRANLAAIERFIPIAETSMKRPTTRDMTILRTKIKELQEEISVKSNRHMQQQGRLMRERQYFIYHHFIESFLVRTYPGELNRILGELLPDFLLPDKVANFQKWNSLLSEITPTRWPTVVIDSRTALISLRQTQLSAAIAQFREQKSELRRWELNEWRRHLIQIEIKLRTNDVKRLRSVLANHRSGMERILNERLIHNFNLHGVSIAVEQLRNLISQRELIDSKSEQIAALHNQTSMARQSFAKLVNEKRDIESRIKNTRNQISNWKRSCRHYNDGGMKKAMDELEGIETQVLDLRNQTAFALESQQQLNKTLDDYRSSDEKLVCLNQERSAVRDISSVQIEPNLINTTSVQKDLIAISKIQQESLHQLHRNNESIYNRRDSILVETPKLEAELEVKDEVIFNATLKQSQSSQTLTDISPNITDKELNLSTWTEKLDLIDEEIRTVNQTLYSRMSALENSVGWPPVMSLHLFHNISRRLNETYLNLTRVEEGLANSTNRTAELVKEFRLAEENYFKKEQEWKEYTKLVEAGVIPRLNFTFEY